MTPTADRPPILRFLLIFVAGLALVTALAALSHTPEAPAGETTSASGKPQP